MTADAGPPIERADVVGRDIELAEAFPTSHEESGPTEHVFVRLEAGGEVGYGEGTALRWFTGETTASMAAMARDQLVPSLLDTPVEAAFGGFRDVAGRLPNNPGATTAVEMALLDLRAKLYGVPLGALLGPRHRDRVPVVWASGALAPGDVADRAAAAYGEGFRTFKVKADGDVPGDAARINAVIDRLVDLGADSAETHVRVDANTGWEGFERASRAVATIDDRGFVEYFEQPVRADRLDAIARLSHRHDVAVFVDEAVHDLDDLRAVAGPSPVASGVCLKLAKAGSPLDLLTMARVANADGLPVTLVSAFETSLGVAAELHLAAAIPRLSSAAELGAELIAEDPVTDPIETTPALAVPAGPGIGVDLDPALFGG